MNVPYVHAPHAEGRAASTLKSEAPNAALLIDFDNVTMGMRSDLSKEFKKLLSSEIIRGKVTVQRAYADWRRYPQYIVPLSEASIDLIFAPAYGSSKKNATDIRMAIDGMELVFIRPEIGTFILLTGDSDFSSLVLKLKEYGKYVIGVGIQESKSDILVQNCDEYYSYTALTGLRKSDESDGSSLDPWVLVEQAAQRMASRGDVMRSDRLKQVMLEIDPGFDESSYGFSRFSRFLTEASSKGILKLKKMENGQYEVAPREEAPAGEGRAEVPEPEASAPSGDGRKGRGGRQRDDRGRGRSRKDRPEAKDKDRDKEKEKGREKAEADRGRGEDRRRGGRDRGADGAGEEGGSVERSELEPAYELLRRAVADLLDDAGEGGVRDSDVKRRMLALSEGFDEAEYGFSKFSRFLRRAHDDEEVELQKAEDGSYWVLPGAGGPAPEAPREKRPSEPEEPARGEPEPEGEKKPAEEHASAREPAEPRAEPEPSREADGERGARLRPRLTPKGPSGRRGEGPPPLLEGQALGGGTGAGEPGPEQSPSQEGEAAAAPVGTGEPLDPRDLQLPTDPGAVIQYMANSYGGVGTKTAEALVERFGANVFRVLQDEPEKVGEVLPEGRARKLLDAWEADLARRRERFAGGAQEGGNGGNAGGGGSGNDDGGDSGGGSGSGAGGGSRGPSRRRTRKRGSSGGKGGGR